MERPLILDFALQRRADEDQKSFTYDDVLNLNVIETKGLKVPFVDVAPSFVELVTKTEARREQDDESPRLTEMYTKPLVARENDDENLNLLELVTKTAAAREGDD